MQPGGRGPAMYGQPQYGQQAPMQAQPGGMMQQGFPQARPAFPGQQGAMMPQQMQQQQFQQQGAPMSVGGPRPGFGPAQPGMQQAPMQNMAPAAPFSQPGARPMGAPNQPFQSGAPSGQMMQQAPASFPGGQGGMQGGPRPGMPGMSGAPMSMGPGATPGARGPAGPAPFGQQGMAGQGQMQQMQGGGMPGPAPGSARGPMPAAGAGAFPGQPQGQQMMGGPMAQGQAGMPRPQGGMQPPQSMQQGMPPQGMQQQQGMPRPQGMQQMPVGPASAAAGPRPGMQAPGPFGAPQGPAAGAGAGAPPSGPFGAGPAARPPMSAGGPPQMMQQGPGPAAGGAGPQAGPGPMGGPMGAGPRGPNPFAMPAQPAAGPAGGAPPQQPGMFPQPGSTRPAAAGGPQVPGPFGGPLQAQAEQAHAPGPFGQGARGMAGPGPIPGPFGAPVQQEQQQYQQQQQQPMQAQQQGMAGRAPGGPLPAAAVMGPIAPPTMGGGQAGAAAPGQTVAMADVNESACCSPAYMCMTTAAIPVDQALMAKTALPFGLCVHPISEGEGTLRGKIPVVNFGQAGVIRCKKCRAYVNPFVAFLDAGRRWRCNFCYFVNDVPPQYFAPCDEAGNRVDRMQRPELSTGTVEFVAPVEYMVRPPQPPVYMFVLDVSFSAVSTGVLASAVNTIRSVLDQLPGQDRVQVGFVTFDTTVHFYRLSNGSSSSAKNGEGQGQASASASRPVQLVVSDIDDLFLPVPDDLLVNLKDARPAVDALLQSLPTTFAGTRNMDSCLGAALEGAYQVMQHVGGKMVVVQACLPTVGPGKLKPREAPRMLGGDQEHTLLAPAQTEDGGVYKTKAIDFSKQQISVDMFLFNHAYADVATLGALSRYTAGQVYFYPTFSGQADALRFHQDLGRNLTRTTGFEAVMRIRASKGVNISNFYGNFFIRGQDLLALPNVTPETAFNVELTHEEPLQPGSVIAVQAALLYTTSSGERRICVHTLAKPVTQLINDLFSRCNVDAVVNMMAKVALDHELRMGVAAARRYLHKQLLDICRAYRAATTAPYGMGMGMGMSGPGGAAGMASRMPMAMPQAGHGPHAGPGSAAAGPGDITTLLPESLQMLPLYVMGLQKSGLFRGGELIRSDERASLVYRCLSMPVTHSRHYVYPRLFNLHEMEPATGRPDQQAEADPTTAGQGRVVLPPVQTLSATMLQPHGCYLLDNGVEQYLWLGREVPGGLLQALFGFESLHGVDVSQLSLVEQGNDYSARVVGIARTLALESYSSPKLRVVREGAASGAGGGGVDGLNEQRFHWHLIEDRQAFPGGSVTYAEYVQIVVKEAAMVSMGGAVPAAS